MNIADELEEGEPPAKKGGLCGLDTTLTQEPRAVAHRGADILSLTSYIVGSYLRGHDAPTEKIDGLIRAVFSSLSRLSRIAGPVGGRTDYSNAAGAKESPKPAVPIQSSITDDYIVCLEDGRKLKMLKRYLRVRYGMTPEEYRTRWCLPKTYPMVARNYSERRSELAKHSRLGRVNRKAAKQPVVRLAVGALVEEGS